MKIVSTSSDQMVSPMSPMYRTAPAFAFGHGDRFPPLQTPSLSPDKASSLKGWDPATTASPATRKTLLDLQGREQAAKQRLNKLQRELHKVRSEDAFRMLRSRKRELRPSASATSLPPAEGVEAASAEVVTQVAKQLHARMLQIEPEHHPRSSLMRLLSAGFSGRIDYAELEMVVRRELHLTPKALPRDTLRAVWAALDAQGRGWIGESDLTRWMRQGEPSVEPYKERLLRMRRGSAKELRAEMDLMFHRDIKAQMEGKTRASNEDMLRVAALLNEHVVQQSRDLNKTICWYRMFKDIDDDRSGLIDYDEFSRMVRNRLGVSKKQLDDEALRAVWLVLDEDSSGHIDSGEFCRFMDKGKPVEPPPPIHKRRETIGVNKRAAHAPADVRLAREAILTLEERARQVDEQAKALEQQLLKAMRARPGALSEDAGLAVSAGCSEAEGGASG